MYVMTFFTKRIHRKLAQGSKVVLTHKLSLLKLAWPAFGILYIYDSVSALLYRPIWPFLQSSNCKIALPAASTFRNGPFATD